MKFNHLKQKQVNYKKHFIQAMYYCYNILLAAIYVFIHAFYPDIYTDAASSKLKKILTEMEKK
tara:strand:+ start:223 stop:411 length:189 start_codon:yes stop_codon:yes gene_type:complete